VIREIDRRAVHYGLEIIHKGDRFKIVEYAFTGLGRLVVRAREVWTTGGYGEPELLDLGTEPMLACPDDPTPGPFPPDEEVGNGS